jgi:hypothetical protein
MAANIRTLAVLVVVAFSAAACTQQQASPPAGGSDERDPAKFSQCMRDQGLSWYPDPQPDGGLVVHQPDGVDETKMKKAEQACAKYFPGGGVKKPAPAEDIAKLRQVSQCMRDHGYDKFPDPDAYGGISVDNKLLGVDDNDPKFRAADQECRKYLPSPRTK